MKGVKLEKDDIVSLKDLFNLCPSDFNYVPLKIFKDSEGVSWASIETIDINGDMLFSGKNKVSNLDFEAGTGMVARLPINKNIINNVFNPEFTSVTIDKNKVISKDDNVKLTISLFQVNEADIIEFPYTNTELYELSKKQNNVTDSQFIKFDMDQNISKQFLDYISLLPAIENLNFVNVSGNLTVKGEDYTGNKIEFNFGVPVDFDLDFNYDMNFVKVFNKVVKYNDCEVNVLISDLLIAITVVKDSMISTIAVTALR